ncbi:MAG TPA: zinc-ribbon domain-containing protein [Tepidisphaeraceae bacterium]|jgi:ribosomal protein L40E
MEFEAFVIVVTLVVVAFIVSVAAGKRNMSRMPQRTCVSCGAAHPPFAQFCRRCGQRLP